MDFSALMDFSDIIMVAVAMTTGLSVIAYKHPAAYKKIFFMLLIPFGWLSMFIASCHMYGSLLKLEVISEWLASVRKFQAILGDNLSFIKNAEVDDRQIDLLDMLWDLNDIVNSTEDQLLIINDSFLVAANTLTQFVIVLMVVVSMLIFLLFLPFFIASADVED